MVIPACVRVNRDRNASPVGILRGQCDRDIGNASFARILDPIAVRIVKHEIANSSRFDVIAEVYGITVLTT